jgi:DNA invertase Pin-like site-specific DNA recombinase
MVALTRLPSSTPLTGEFRAERIQSWHHDRLAVVYVRQSTPQQVLDHQESTRLQYGLVHQAQHLGWPPERIVVIDDDLGKSGTSAAGRVGFQRVVSEVSLDHVGIIIGIEMSRLARSNKDWHQLLELCALFRTLIADLDGIYDPSQYNDRLLLGLKGTMSEAEIHILKQRMHQGLLSKARRGELAFSLPTGYVWTSAGEIAFDPDEQVQEVVRLIFRLFEELGTSGAVLRYLAEHDIRIGVRVREGPGKGTLVWRRPNRMTLQNLLKHPIYAGAYVYGRRQVDPRRHRSDQPRSGRVVVGADAWLAFVPDHCPAYISMAQYEANQARLQANRARAEAMGAVRDGPALLAGLVVCAHCGQRMIVRYDGPPVRHTYECTRLRGNYGGPLCQHLPGACLDQFVTAQVLSALAPATLELSLAAAEHLEEERATVDRLWQQRRERAAYEAARVARQYQAVEPENRLVARTLERAWEEKLATQQQLEEEYHRFLRQQPRLLTAEERTAIRQLAADIPGLWAAPTTTAAERKEIVRQVVTRVVAAVEGASERVHVHLEWVGGRQTAGEVVRPIAQLRDLSYYPQLCDRVRALTATGCSLPAIGQQLEAEGYRPAHAAGHFGPAGIAAIQRQLGLRSRRHRRQRREGLAPDEWWPAELAQLLDCTRTTLHYWIHHGWVHARREPQAPWRWIIWADAAEVERLRQLRQRSLSAEAHGRWLDEHPRERRDPSAAMRTKDRGTTTDQTPRALQP